MITIKSLEGISAEKLYHSFSRAFEDYERSWSREEFEKMLHRRSFNPSLSFGALDDDMLVAFTFNGIGSYNGIPSAYDTGTGTVKEYRGQGLAGRIFEFSMPHLVKAGIRQYLLEVLQHNETAVKIYKGTGFSVTRELNYFIQEKKIIINKPVQPKASYQIRPLDTLMPDQMKTFWDFFPTWQNTLDAIQKQLRDFMILGAFNRNQLVGYGIIEISSGDIPQLAVHQDFRRQGIGSAIFNTLLNDNKASWVRVINTDVQCESITRFLAANNIPVTGKQFEMILQI